MQALRRLYRRTRAIGLSLLQTYVPPGHYYSPLADLDDLKRRADVVFDRDAPVPDIDLRLADQEGLFMALAAHAARLTFAETKAAAAAAGHRYYDHNEFFGSGDAAVLAAMLLEFKPRRVIEVGSGYSSALLLDVNDRFFAGGVDLTFVEPYPQRLEGLLSGADRGRVRIIRERIQLVPLDEIAALQAGDILFIDSTHVAKGGSDVNHIFFRIFPLLAPGVIVHLHDIFYPFEYPREWFFNGNRSWNELYVLRAFLMNNADYRVLFFNDAFAYLRPDLRDQFPAFWRNPGGGFWMIKER